MMARKWMVALVALWSPLALACINSETFDNRGRQYATAAITGESLVESLTTPYDSAELRANEEETIGNARSEPTFQHLNELGVLLIMQGKYVDAARLFTRMERIFPERYQTAANLGTTMELMGRDRLALRWIRIGIRRNAASHAGTEWLHARILEAKIALAADPGYLDGRSVAGIVFDPVLVPPLPKAYPPGNTGQPVKPHELEEALGYQLSERLRFVKPKDPVVANLLVDWATLHLVGGSIENVAPLYRLADRYGATPTVLRTAREREARRIVAAHAKQPAKGIGYCTICPPPDSVESLPQPSPLPRKPGDPPPPPPPPPLYRQ